MTDATVKNNDASVTVDVQTSPGVHVPVLPGATGTFPMSGGHLTVSAPSLISVTIGNVAGPGTLAVTGSKSQQLTAGQNLTMDVTAANPAKVRDIE
jgi:hypothetical protein